MIRLLHALASTAALAFLGSCVVAALAVGAAAVFGVVKYTENEATMDFHADVATVFAAAQKTMQDQGYPVNAEQKPGSAIEGKIAAGDASVWVERQAGEFTKARVRIGTFDTEDHRRRASLILEGVKKRLGE